MLYIFSFLLLTLAVVLIFRIVRSDKQDAPSVPGGGSVGGSDEGRFPRLPEITS